MAMICKSALGRDSLLTQIMINNPKSSHGQYFKLEGGIVMKGNISLVFLLVCLLIVPLVFAEPIAQSGIRRVALIEVYTSEGCGSCAWAYQWLTVQLESSILWTKFVPVDFHVTYWDYLGWPDKLANVKYTQRQKDYFREWGKTSGVYTPGFVFNGKEWLEWDQPFLYESKETEEVGELSVEQKQRGLYRVRFTPVDRNHQFQAHVVLLGFDIVSDVKSGANTGATFTHDFAVLNYGTSRMYYNLNGVFEAEVYLEKPPGALPEKQALAAWITLDAELIPFQATGGFLPL